MVDVLQRISAVIRTDATYAKSEDFLATHVPFRNLKFGQIVGEDLGTGQIIDEETFFHDFFVNNNDQHQFITVIGDNGAGKSHFIRWLKEKYSNIVSDNEEAFLLISRSQSTLRGALEQIINSNIFTEQVKTEELRKLVQANEHLSDSALKKNIVLQFAALASEQVEDAESEDNPLEKRYRKYVYHFLVDSVIQDFLFEKGGPIDRIKARLHAEDNERKDEIDPRFFPHDFALTLEVLQRMKSEGSHKNAIRFGESLREDVKGYELREKLAKFLNKNLETVIQNTTNLRAADLKQVFEKLRRELKKTGKNLTLFIEDITAFTGIDRALVEVLVTEHTGREYNDEFCRLISCIGITNDYFANSFPNNLRDRITSWVKIDKATLVNNDEIIEMGARYINAIYLESKILQDWLARGANEDDLPVANRLNKSEWANYTLANGRVLSIFPFNQTSLVNMYKILNLKQKTPRAFLRGVIKRMLQEYVANQDEFPPAIKELTKEFILPIWKEPGVHEQNVENQAQYFEGRVKTLLNIWGDGTAYRRENSGDITVGNLSKDVFQAFRLPFIEGTPAPAEDQSSEVIKKPASVDVHDLNRTTKTSYSRSDSYTPSSTIPKIVTEKTKDKYHEVYEELEKWSYGDKLRKYYKELRDDVVSILLSFIDWEAESIPMAYVSEVINRNSNNVVIEGSTMVGEGRFQIPRNTDTKYALMALAAWRYKGKRTWNYEGSAGDLLNLYKWLNLIKADVIKAIKTPEGISEAIYENTLRWGLLSEFYLQVFTGNLSLNQSSLEDIYNQIFKNDYPKIVVEEERSNDWKSLQQKLLNQKTILNIDQHHEFIIRYFNLLQGSNMETNVFILNAQPIMLILKELQESGWGLTEPLDLPDIPKESNINKIPWGYSFSLLSLLKGRIAPAIQGEIEEMQRLKGQLENYLGKNFTSEDVRVLFAKMKNFLTVTLEEANENYDSEKFTAVIKEILTAEKLLSNLKSIEQAISTTDLHERVLWCSANPRKEIQPFLALFERFENLINEKHARYQTKSSQTSVPKIDKLVSETKKLLIKLKEDFIKVSEVRHDVTQ